MDNRHRLLDCALELLANGYDAVVCEIVEAAGVTKHVIPLFYEQSGLLDSDST